MNEMVDTSSQSYEAIFNKLDDIYSDIETDHELIEYRVLESFAELLAGIDSTSNLSKLRTIAEYCAFFGGPAVLDARSILAKGNDSLFAVFSTYDTLCTVGGSLKTEKDLSSIMTESLDENHNRDYILLPNLQDGYSNAFIMLGEKENGTVEIYNMTGSLVLSQEVQAGNNTIPINGNKFSSGVYLYKVRVNKEVKRTDKLVVIKK